MASQAPVRVCDLAGGGCGELDGEVQIGVPIVLRSCPKCGTEGGLGRCATCHQEHLSNPLPDRLFRLREPAAAEHVAAAARAAAAEHVAACAAAGFAAA